MAKRFDETVNLQPVDTSTGAAQAALSLADQLESFKVQATNIAAERAVARGEASAGAVRLEEKDGITQAPEMQSGAFFGSIERNAHNKTLKGAYLASLSNDITESVNAIEAENPTDLLKFNDSANGLTKGILSGVEPSARQQVATFLDGKVISARNRVHKAGIAADRAEATASMQLAANNAADESQALARAGDLLGSAEKLQEFFTINAAMVEGGLMTPVESEMKRREAEFGATKEVLIGGVNQQIKDGDFNGAIESIQALRDKIPAGFTTDEHDEVVTAMISEVNETIALESKIEDWAAADMKADQTENSINLFTGIVSGTKNAQDVIAGLKKREIGEEDGTRLLNVLNTRGQGVDDWGMVTRIQARIRNGQEVSFDILANTGTNLTEKTATDLLAMDAEAKEAKTSGKSFTTDPNYKQAESFIRRKMRVTGPFGALDTEAESRLADAERELFFGVQGGENPWAIADSLISLDDLNSAPNPKYGSKEDLDGAEDGLNAAFDTNQIDEPTYNFQFRLIQQLRQITAINDEYTKARKAAADAARR